MVVTEEIKEVVSRGEQAIRFEKRWITRDSLVQEISRLQEICFRTPARENIFGSSVEFESGDVICGSSLNSSLFACRKAGLQLLGNRSCDLTLNREYIGDIAVITLSPKPSIGGDIDQLSVDAHPIARSLDGSFHHTRNTELLADLAQVARDSAFVLHYRGAADHFQIGQAG